MAALYTIDASVFLNAFNPFEEGHQDSRRLLALLQEQAAPIIVPTLLLPEVAAAIARGRDDAELARRFAATLKRLPHLVWVPLDETLAQQAAEVAAQYRLRGSDAVYAGVALRFGSTLVSLDRVIPAQEPAGLLGEF
jgi:predicted nucleic acid-binding protein